MAKSLELLVSARRFLFLFVVLPLHCSIFSASFLIIEFYSWIYFACSISQFSFLLFLVWILSKWFIVAVLLVDECCVVKLFLSDLYWIWSTRFATTSDLGFSVISCSVNGILFVALGIQLLEFCPNWYWFATISKRQILWSESKIERQKRNKKDCNIGVHFVWFVSKSN